jgi:hypothetical protein
VVVDAVRGQQPGENVLVTEAQVVYVNLGPDRKPAAIRRTDLHPSKI